MKANHVCQALRRVVGNAKAVKQIHKFRPTSLSLDARTFTYRESDQSVGVTLLNGRVWFVLKIGGYQMALLRGQKPTSATLSKTKQGDYYLNVAIDLPTPPTGKTPKVIGVDLGRRDIATASHGRSWSGQDIQKVRDRFSRVRANVQAKRTRSSRRLLRRLAGRERRYQTQTLVQDAVRENAVLAFEDLSGIRQSLKFVPPAYTSQTCHNCLHIHPEPGKSYRNGKHFRCEHCLWEGDADFNASRVIAALGATVNSPEVPFTSVSRSDNLAVLWQLGIGIKPAL